MKPIRLTLTLALGLLACTGCTTRYQIRLNNGVAFTTKGKPDYDARRNLWFYTDVYGHTNAISGLRVVEVGPAPRHPEETQFKFISPGH